MWRKGMGRNDAIISSCRKKYSKKPKNSIEKSVTIWMPLELPPALSKVLSLCHMWARTSSSWCVCENWGTWGIYSPGFSLQRASIMCSLGLWEESPVYGCLIKVGPSCCIFLICISALTPDSAEIQAPLGSWFLWRPVTSLGGSPGSLLAQDKACLGVMHRGRSQMPQWPVAKMLSLSSIPTLQASS